jgi:DNA primase
LPLPAEYEPQAWPLDARVWLYKAGISNVEIKQLGIFWNSRLARVVLPVRDEAGKVIYWQARTLDKANPRKYLNPRVDKARLVAKYKPLYGSGPALVLTEDLLSAYRVSRAGFEAWSLLGTKVSDYVATRIIELDKPVAVFLDPDKTGREKAAIILKALRSYGVGATNIQSEKDPKLLSTEVIQCLLSSRLGMSDTT